MKNNALLFLMNEKQQKRKSQIMLSIIKMFTCDMDC